MISAFGGIQVFYSKRMNVILRCDESCILVAPRTLAILFDEMRLAAQRARAGEPYRFDLTLHSTEPVADEFHERDVTAAREMETPDQTVIKGGFIGLSVSIASEPDSESPSISVSQRDREKVSSIHVGVDLLEPVIRIMAYAGESALSHIDYEELLQETMYSDPQTNRARGSVLSQRGSFLRVDAKG